MGDTPSPNPKDADKTMDLSEVETGISQASELADPDLQLAKDMNHSGQAPRPDSSGQLDSLTKKRQRKDDQMITKMTDNTRDDQQTTKKPANPRNDFEL